MEWVKSCGGGDVKWMRRESVLNDRKYEVDESGINGREGERLVEEMEKNLSLGGI